MSALRPLSGVQKETIGLQIFQRMAAEENKKEERVLRRLGIEPAAISEVGFLQVSADGKFSRRA
jgi:hypothetical protein